MVIFATASGKLLKTIRFFESCKSCNETCGAMVVGGRGSGVVVVMVGVAVIAVVVVVVAVVISSGTSNSSINHSGHGQFNWWGQSKREAAGTDPPLAT